MSLSQYESDVINHRPIIQTSSDNSARKHIRQLMVAHDDKIYYLSNEGLFLISYKSKEWKKQAEPYFEIENGNSLTSTPEGLVYLGGNTEGKTTMDIWIFATDRWRVLRNEVSSRAHHACAWIPNQEILLISGGSYDHSVLSDFVSLDLKSGKSKEIELSMKLRFTHHTISYMKDDIVCLYGGIKPDKSENTDIYIINLKTGNVNVLNAPNLFSVRKSHIATVFYGNLLITGGFSQSENTSDALLFMFDEKIWLKLQFQASFEPTYVFPMKLGFFLIDETGSKTCILYYKGDQMPFTGTNDPQYLSFLSNLLDSNILIQRSYPLIESLNKFVKSLKKEKTSLSNEIERLYEKDELYQTAKNISDYISEKNTLIRIINILQKIKKVQDNKEPPKNVEFFNIQKNKEKTYELCNKLNELKKNSKEEIKNQTIEIENLYSEIENSLSKVLLNNKDKQKINFSNEVLFKASINDSSIIDNEITNAKNELEIIQARISKIQNKRSNVITDSIAIFDNIDQSTLEIFNVKKRIASYKLQINQLIQELINYHSKKLFLYNPLQKDIIEQEQKISILNDQISELQMQNKKHHNFINETTQIIKSKTYKLIDSISSSSKEIMLSNIISLTDSLVTLVKQHNKIAQKIDSNDSSLKLPTMNEKNEKLSRWTIKNSINHEESFIDDTLLRTGGWNNLYSFTSKYLSKIEPDINED